MHSDPEYNIKAPHCLLFSTRARCPHCSRSTEVNALGFPVFYERRSENEAADDEEGTGIHDDDDAWCECPGPVLVSMLQDVSSPAAEAITRLAPRLHPDLPGGLWLNHCAHCGAAIADEDLHEGLGDAFVPVSTAQAQNIHMVRVDMPCNALVGCTHHVQPWSHDVHRA